ncbi:MAG: ATP-binding cassette domain-containing protein [Cyclobacteriaceae bacterium]
MSEEILKALTQLFAIITKQDGGVTDNERNYVISMFKEDLDQGSIKEYIALYDQFLEEDRLKNEEKEKKGKVRLTSVRDSVRTLAICKKINKTLTQKQKIVVLFKLLELVGADRKFTEQRMEIINTVSDVFNIEQDEYKLIESFILHQSGNLIDHSELLLVHKEHKEELGHTRQIISDIDGELLFVRVKSVDMYFVRYLGGEEINLNGYIIKPGFTNQFSHGSTLKTPKGDALYYSDFVSHFSSESQLSNISFIGKNINLIFPNGAIGLRDVNIVEGPGKLIGIMGASGAGKTTLLNVLAGIHAPTSGEIRINGIAHNGKDAEAIKGVVGYIAQDDLLIEELTVYENLFYNAKLCFADLNEEEIHNKVISTLTNLGLDQRKDLKVGSVLDKTISGGQRKRLNIALELIREPAILFVDEPTSGLSSRDSENVIDLLKELSLKGKLIFVVIHQPSSDIYKMFDKMIIMDTGGYPVYYGPPVEAVTYFKRETNQVGSERGQCPACGNVNPEQIFNIIDAKVVDEYGEFTNRRKITPEGWNELYRQHFKIDEIEEVKELPPKSLVIPTWLSQAVIFTKRDLLSKFANKQYMLINFLEAPILAFLLAFIIRYKNDPTSNAYVFRFNDNIPIFIMMAVIVALFIGLTVSAEEIIKDRKILKRESFLNLSWNSYLLSKVVILFSLSAVQTLTFTIVSNGILSIHEMTLTYWLVLFSISCQANVIGLNISSAFDRSVTAYILIPFLIIPQMVLSGLLFNFDKLNELISSKGKVPVVADFMSSRWAYEAIAVEQFKTNSYQRPFYGFESDEMQADFKASYWIKEMRTRLNYAIDNAGSEDEKIKPRVERYLSVIRNEIKSEPVKTGIGNLDLNQDLSFEKFNAATGGAVGVYLDSLNNHYLGQFNLAVAKKERLIYLLQNQEDSEYDLNEYKNRYMNESLTDLVRNLNAKDRIIEYKGRLVQQIDPIYTPPANPSHLLDYRTHFFAPQKHFLGIYFETFTFNVIVMWIMTAFLYLALYKEWLRKALNAFGQRNQ